MTDRTPPADEPGPGTRAYEPETRSSEPVPGTDAPMAEPLVDNRARREDVVARERSEFGGMKFGSAFFGWLTATGMAVLLTALVAAAGAAVGVGATGSPNAAADQVGKNAATVGIAGAIALVVILFASYFCGGYVAGRMARFNGLRQGVAVWIWAVIMAVVVAILSLILGSQYNILGNLNSFPRIPLDEGSLTLTGIVTAVAVAVVSLIAAALGGLAGMRYHRRIDRVGFAPDPTYAAGSTAEGARAGTGPADTTR
ncbi:YrzE family protein [Leifsonia shinshuensis]|uniref:YrzE family protein n=1 Tax=Leifsonia shinshuensis TaxID=150026 RepID=UPI001F508B1B|nr:YrzE family protein [Leifsonia shinshuensis]